MQFQLGIESNPRLHFIDFMGFLSLHYGIAINGSNAKLASIRTRCNTAVKRLYMCKRCQNQVVSRELQTHTHTSKPVSRGVLIAYKIFCKAQNRLASLLDTRP